MSISAEMFIVISLMLAVFAAVAVVGSSIVLGVGFERLRAGFDIVKKQTGFFAEAIHKLDQKSKELEDTVISVEKRVDGVEKQSGFFFQSLHTLEEKILKGSPVESALPEKPAAQKLTTELEPKDDRDPSIMPKVMEWNATSEAKSLLQANEDKQINKPASEAQTTSSGLTASIVDYLLSDNRNRDVVYH